MKTSVYCLVLLLCGAAPACTQTRTMTMYTSGSGNATGSDQQQTKSNAEENAQNAANNLCMGNVTNTVTTYSSCSTISTDSQGNSTYLCMANAKATCEVQYRPEYQTVALRFPAASLTPDLVPSLPNHLTSAPVYKTAPRLSNSSYCPPSSAQSTQGCRDMIACVKVVSSTYDANHFLHVVVRNDCGSPIRITTSTYAQNLSCTMGQTAIFNPGDSEDMGSVTDRNWYQIQADDSVRTSIDGTGCKLVVANSCLDKWRR